MEGTNNNDILEIKKDIRDILDTVNAFANHTEEQFAEIKQEIGGIKQEIGVIKQEIGGIKQEIGGIKQDVTQIKATMVTKAYLDDKLADLRGDLTIYDRKQDKKVDFLTQTLAGKKVLTSKEADAIVAMSPFPQPPRIS
jgi:chromosome segregation ATPase